MLEGDYDLVFFKFGGKKRKIERRESFTFSLNQDVIVRPHLILEDVMLLTSPRCAAEFRWRRKFGSSKKFTTSLRC